MRKKTFMVIINLLLTMKRFLTSLMAVASIAMLIPACSTDATENFEPTVPMKQMTLTVADDVDMRTEIADNGTIVWSEEESLKVFETVDGLSTATTTTSFTKTGDFGTFGVEFPENTTATEFVYNAVSPASAWWNNANSNSDPSNVEFILPTTQKPSASSFDPVADILIANTQTFTAQPSEIQFGFARIVGMGKMTIKNLASEAFIKTVTITVEGHDLSNGIYYNLNTGLATGEYYKPANQIILDYSEQEIYANNMDVHFACFPFAMSESDVLKVVVTTSANEVFTKEISMEGKEKLLAFAEGRRTVFGLNMAGIENSNGPKTYNKVTSLAEITEGEYIITNGDYYLPSAATNAGPGVFTLASQEITFVDGSYTGVVDNTVRWFFTGDNENGFYIQNADGDYLYTTNTNNGIRVADTDNAWKFSIHPEAADANADFAMQDQATNRFCAIYVASGTPSNWRCYTSATASNYQVNEGIIHLYKVGQPDTRVALDTPTGLAFEVSEDDAKQVTVTWNSVENADEYTVTCAEAEAIEVEGESAVLTFPSFSTDYEVSVVAMPAANDEAHKPSAAATITVTTGQNTASVPGTIAGLLQYVGEVANNASVSVADFNNGTVDAYIAANSAVHTDIISVVDNTGEPYSGIAVYGTALESNTALVEGKKVTLNLSDATVKNYNGLYELLDVEFTVSEESATIVVPTITAEQLNSNAYMGMYVKLANVTAPATSGTWSGNKTLTDSNGTSFKVYTKGSALTSIQYTGGATGTIWGIASNYNGAQLAPTKESDLADFTVSGIEFAETAFTVAATATSLEIPFTLIGEATADYIASLDYTTGTTMQNFAAAVEGTNIVCTFDANADATGKQATIVVKFNNDQEDVTLTIEQGAAGAAVEQTEGMDIFGTTGVKNGSDSISWTGTNFMVTNNKTSSSSAIRTQDSDHYRIYAHSDLVVTPLNGITISKVVFTCPAASAASAASYTSALAAALGENAEVDGAVVTLTETITAAKTWTPTAQTRLTNVEITYTAGQGGGDEPEPEPVQLQQPAPSVSGTTVSWAAIANASSYAYTTNGGTTTVNTNATSLDCSDWAAGTYNVQVRAEGDGTNFTTSEWSTAVTVTIEEQGGGDEPATGGYTKITSLTDLTDGEYIVTAYTGSKYIALPTEPTLNSGKITGAEITVTDNTISESDAEGYVWTITKSGNYYTLSYGSKSLYHSNGGASGTNLTYDTSTSYPWSITFEKDVFKFAGVASGTVKTRGMTYRIGSANVFGGYSLSNFETTEYKGITLFKKKN